MYWDDEKEPSVECPVGDFFASAFNEYAQLSSLAVCVNPGSAFNCYWKMPFRKKARITLENINNAEEMRLYYQINYTLTEVPEDEDISMRSSAVQPDTRLYPYVGGWNQGKGTICRNLFGLACQ